VHLPVRLHVFMGMSQLEKRASVLQRAYALIAGHSS
jgi:hypothetical protein